MAGLNLRCSCDSSDQTVNATTFAPIFIIDISEDTPKCYRSDSVVCFPPNSPKFNHSESDNIYFGDWKRKRALSSIPESLDEVDVGSLSTDVNTNTKSRETWYKIMMQVAFPMLFSGFGMVGAGILLDKVSTMDVFMEIKDMLSVVTPLLGMKGNLEMTLGSRLSTHSNLGHMNTWQSKIAICAPNLCLDQVQAVVAGFMAAVLAIVFGIILTGESFDYENTLILVSTCCMTGSLVSLVLGILMCTIVIVAKKFNFNPDNFSTIFAGMLGDCVTLALLAITGYLIFKFYHIYPWIPFVTLSVNLVSLPICGVIAFNHTCTQKVLMTGWVAVLLAVFISSGGGLILEKYESKHGSLTFYQPLINGIGGNLVSVLASRIATQLHRDCDKGVLPGNGSVFMSPSLTFFGKTDQHAHVVVARILLALVIPCQIMFPSVVHAIANAAEYSAMFLFLFVSASLIQVFILLYMSRILANVLWKLKSDPDNSIPYLTAFGDLIGSSLLLAVFETLLLIK